MRIDSGTIGMDSVRTMTSVTLNKNTVTAQGSEKTTNNSFNRLMAGLSNYDNTAGLRTYSSRSVSDRDYREALARIREECIKYLISLFMGGTSEKNNGLDGWSTPSQNEGGAVPALLTMDTEYYHAETENLEFNTTGCVVTADGRQITFGLTMQMSRTFEEYYSEKRNMDISSMIDPLVINIGTDVGSLSDQKFLFDLDGDGTKENISKLSSGSGFLALDKNNDGIINDGTELFGTKSGDGFADLAAFDDDGDGFIDEDDAVFDKLKIWTTDENGKDILYTLKEAGVGAICLSSVETDFSYNSINDNATNGALRRTGVFLYENGDVGTVQHIDIAR